MVAERQSPWFGLRAGAAVFLLLLSSVAGCSRSDIDHPALWGAGLVNDSDVTYLVTINEGPIAFAAPARSRIDLGGAGVGDTKNLLLFSTDCRKAGAVSLSSERPQAYVDPVGIVTALGSDGPNRASSGIQTARFVSGFTCAAGGWQVLVRNDLGIRLTLRLTGTPHDRWTSIAPGGRAPLETSVGGPFPSGVGVAVYADDCHLLGAVHPTIGEGVVYVTGDGVSLRGTQDFWVGLSREHLTWGLSSDAPSPCAIFDGEQIGAQYGQGGWVTEFFGPVS